jgi:tetratricopeptide (TPR) repeat protein
MLLLSIITSFIVTIGLYLTGQKFEKKKEKINRCWEYLNNGACGKAIDCCKTLIEKYPNVSALYYCLGLAYHHIGKIEPALENFKKAEELKNTLPHKISWNSLLINEIKFYIDYAKVLRSAKRYNESLKYYSMVLNAIKEEKSERIKELLQEIAETYEEIGDIDNAIDYYEELLTYTTDKSYLYEKINKLYKMSNNKEKYHLCLEKI